MRTNWPFLRTIGYFKRPDLYEAQLSPADDGGAPWFDTGDLARRRPDGGIRIAGRTKDLVIRGGENVPVVEVEAVLFGHPKVREVAVIGYPDDRLGERACAVVVADPDAGPVELGELTAWLDRAGMAKQFWPERLELVDAMQLEGENLVEMREQALELEKAAYGRKVNKKVYALTKPCVIRSEMKDKGKDMKMMKDKE